MKKTVIVLIVLMGICTAGYTQQWRVVSKVYDTYLKSGAHIVYKDSVHFYYNYSSGRGSDASFDIAIDKGGNYHKDGVSCDSSRSYRRSITYANTGGANDTSYTSEKCERTYDSTGILLLSKYYRPNTPAEEENYTYDTAYNLIKFVNNKYEYSYDYDTTNRFIKEMQTDIASGNTKIIEYIYDTLGLLIKDSTYATAGNGKTLTYYYYDTSQNRVLDVQYRIGGTTPIPLDTHYTYHIYDQANHLIKDSSFYTGASQGVYNNVFYTYYPDGKLHSMYGGDLSVTYTYTSFGHVATADYETFYQNSMEGYIRFNYEHYWPAGVANTIKNEADLKVYPVPANNMLHVEAEFKEGGKLQGSVTDMQGSVVYQWKDGATTNYKKQVQLGHLPAGIYMLQLYTDNEVATQQFIKQ